MHTNPNNICIQTAVLLCISLVSYYSILGRIIRVTQEVDDYREWIRKKWGSPLNSMFRFSHVFEKSNCKVTLTH